MILQAVYIVKYPVLTSYAHGFQRFIQAAHLANTVLGQPDELPVSFLELLRRIEPDRKIKWIDGVSCEDFPKELLRRYCETDLFKGNTTKVNPFSFAELVTVKLHPEETFPFKSTEAAAYSPLGYAPFVLPLVLGLWLELPPVVLADMAVACNALVTIGLGMYLLSILPVLRWPVFFLLMLPSSFMIRSFVMPDALNLDICFLILALALRHYYHPRQITRGDIITMLLLAAGVGGIKIVFFLAPLIYAVIPSRCFARSSEKYGFVIVSLSVSVLVAALWDYYAAERYWSMPVMQNSQEILRHPVRFTQLIYSPLFDNWLLYNRIFNSILLWNRIVLIPEHWLLTALLMPLPLLALVEVQGECSKKFPLRFRALGGAIFLATWGFILTAMFLHNEMPLDGQTLSKKDVLQGRYCVPVLPYLLLTMQSIITLPERGKTILRSVLVVYALLSLVCLNYYTLYLP